MERQSRTYTPAKTESARVFVIPGGARQDRNIHYASFMKVGTGSQNLGDITRIEIPSDVEFGKFLEVGQIRGSKERPTTQLIQKMPMELRSLIDRLARRGEAFDVHVQFGECLNPQDINEFSLGWVYEYAMGNSYENDELVALDGGETAEIRETLSISSRDQYKYLPMAYFDREPTAIINEIKAVAVKRDVGCDDFPMLFAVTAAEGGSPGTGPYILFSIDEGATWHAHDVDPFDDSEDASGVDSVGNNVIVISEDAGSLAYSQLDEFYHPETPGFDPEFTEVDTGFEDNPLAISSAGMKGFIVGDDGYIYSVEEPSEGVRVLDAGEASGGHALGVVYAMNDKYVIAGGEHGRIVFSTNGETFSASPNTPVGVGVEITAVAMRYESEWWVGTDAGTLFVSLDRGLHWTQVGLPGTTPTAIDSIAWASHSVGFIAGQVGGRGRVYRTICGGISWSVQPQSSTYSMPVADRFNQLAINRHDPNFVLGGGIVNELAIVDGVLLLGTDAVK